MAIKVSKYTSADIEKIQAKIDKHGDETPEKVVARYLGPETGLELDNDRKTVKVAEGWQVDGDGRIWTYEASAPIGIQHPKHVVRKQHAE